MVARTAGTNGVSADLFFRIAADDAVVEEYFEGKKMKLLFAIEHDGWSTWTGTKETGSCPVVERNHAWWYQYAEHNPIQSLNKRLR